MKKIGLFIIGVFSVMSFVSAQYGGSFFGGDLGSNLNYGVNQLIYLFESFLGPVFAIIFGGYSSNLFVSVLFATIILCVVYLAVGRVPLFRDSNSNNSMKWIITVAVTLLSVRILGESGVVETLLIPYSVLGVTLTSALPFLIYAFFVYQFDEFEHSFIRRILWSFFIITFIGIWISRKDEIGSLSWIYFWTAGLAFVMALFDNSFYRWKLDRERKTTEYLELELQISRKRKDIGDIEKGTMPPTAKRTTIKRLRNDIKNLEKAKKDI